MLLNVETTGRFIVAVRAATMLVASEQRACQMAYRILERHGLLALAGNPAIGCDKSLM